MAVGPIALQTMVRNHRVIEALDPQKSQRAVNEEPSRHRALPRQDSGRLIDRFGRVHTSLRLSVTDACNIRCRYCMPETVNGFMPQDRLMSFDAIERVVRTLAQAGIRKIRLTGGEPLMRPRLTELVERLSEIPDLDQIAMTTNGMLLADAMSDLAAAGLTHINISLDTLREEAFRRMSRREGLDRVLTGIDAAVASGLPVRLNAVLLRDLNLDDCIPLVKFALERGVVIRFIEFMPLDADRAWSQSQVVTGRELRERIEAEVGQLTACEASEPSQPSRDFLFVGGSGRVGFIDPVSEPFCGTCNRLRLTADGKFRNCLFGRDEWDAMALIQQGAPDGDILKLASQCIESKHLAHGISEEGFEPPTRAMYQIGG
ncbi:MAG: GTP 3',8-cyclase MoaA [Planctomycetota bacterium]|jgi:cyclic pyranopterin phosphate synthase